MGIQQMKSRPILMSSPMVRAILEGKKTQTRRIIKPQREVKWFDNPCGLHVQGSGWFAHITENDTRHDQEWQGVKCPYGTVGDQLWVRETWANLGHWEGFEPRRVEDADGNVYNIVYRAEHGDFSWTDDDGFMDYNKDGSEKSGWKPSIHMKRIFSRITLEITDIRVQRLQEISEVDAYYEGCHYRFCKTCDQSGFWEKDAVCEDCAGEGGFKSYDEFRTLWQSINGEQSWWDNPWVWALNFKVIEP